MVFRLINTITLKLERFDDQRIPKYAILSHTWNGDEISCVEMNSINGESSHPATRKSGYVKIRATCETARSGGFDYAWVDTCCIDKSSSSELAEAINSMFHWYRRADVCFVHLSDLSPTSEIDDCLPLCRWFTRGWCLQELIAPREVRFYNNCWEYIGDKSIAGLRELISRITKIDTAVLSDASLLPTFPVAQKMSWASRRETTRLEDVAYCLLGIFEINMPLLYGEGPKAFLRLQEEIIKQSNDLSIFAWEHPISISSQSQEQHGPAAFDTGADNSFSTDPHSCSDLFAQSPGDFSGCGNIVLQHEGSFRNLTFSMTNNGLFLSRMDLRLSFDNNCYLLPLLCCDKKSPSEFLCLVLKMVQAGFFVRLHQYRMRNLFIGNEKVDGYVLTHMTPHTRNRVASSHSSSVQLRNPSSSKSMLYTSILEHFPRDIWDASRLAFLNCDEGSIMGYCKLNGRRLCQTRPSFQDPQSDYFYLAWGSLHLLDIRNIGRSRETIWVRLYSLEAWERSRTIRGPIYIEVDSTQASELETDQLGLASLHVKVGVILIEELGRSFFRIDVMVDNINLDTS